MQNTAGYPAGYPAPNTVHYEKKKHLAAGPGDHPVFHHLLTDIQKLGAYQRMVHVDPNQFTQNLPAFLVSIGPGSRAIYRLCLLLIAGVLISLPLVRVRVSVTGNGIIRPQHEKTNILPGISGLFEEVFVSEGEYVEKSDPILKVRSFDAARNLQLLKMELTDIDQYLADLNGLLNDPVIVPTGQKFWTAFQEYRQHFDYLELMYEKAQKEWIRQSGLFKAGLISEKEYDDLTFSRNKAKKEMLKFMSESRRAWQQDHSAYLDRKRTITTQIQQTEEQIRRSMILAPVSGSLEEFSGIFPGSILHTGDIIGVISPDSRLIAEIYMASKDIAYLTTGQEVSMQVDAFPSREWGLVKAEIYDISNDYIWLDQQAVYRVKCRFPEERLVLKNGYEGELIKGMTFQARCMVASRSLFQLLTDKADDWLDPMISSQRILIGP
jgi:multidrug resistance efflux pump